jgi:hypothetical protein
MAAKKKGHSSLPVYGRARDRSWKCLYSCMFCAIHDNLKGLSLLKVVNYKRDFPKTNAYLHFLVVRGHKTYHKFYGKAT